MPRAGFTRHSFSSFATKGDNRAILLQVTNNFCKIYAHYSKPMKQMGFLKNTG